MGAVLSDMKPAEIARRGIQEARKQQADYVIVDTSGRLQIDKDMMRELKDTKRACSPDEVHSFQECKEKASVPAASRGVSFAVNRSVCASSSAMKGFPVVPNHARRFQFKHIAEHLSFKLPYELTLLSVNISNLYTMQVVAALRLGFRFLLLVLFFAG